METLCLNNFRIALLVQDSTVQGGSLCQDGFEMPDLKTGGGV
jgi:hypothetical protein